jgi:hypothetical protein
MLGNKVRKYNKFWLQFFVYTQSDLLCQLDDVVFGHVKYPTRKANAAKEIVVIATARLSATQSGL